MSYKVNRSCGCGRMYSHDSEQPDPGKCTVCKPPWKKPAKRSSK